MQPTHCNFCKLPRCTNSSCLIEVKNDTCWTAHEQCHVKPILSKEAILEAARCASFMQQFKLQIWESGFEHIKESTLDELAMIAYKLLK